jgi:hypothetical protein
MARVGSSGFDALASLISERIAVSESAMIVPTLPSPSSSKWNCSSGERLSQSVQQELLRHLATCGVHNIISSRVGWSPADLQTIRLLLAEIDANLKSFNSTSANAASIAGYDRQLIIPSSRQNSQSVVWRISMAPTVQGVSVLFADGSAQELVRPIGEMGIWFTHSASRSVARFTANFTTGGSGSPGAGGSGGSVSSSGGSGSPGAGGSGGSVSSSGGSGSSGSGGNAGSALSTGGSGSAGSGGSGGSAPSTSGSGSSGSGGSSSDFLVLSDESATPGSRPTGRYLIIYQGVDPNSFVSGTMDPSRVVSAIASYIAAGRIQSHGVLDFEHPFDEIMDNGPSDPRYSAAMQSLISTIRAVKAAFPTIAWTYYNWPRVRYWYAGRGWDAIPEAERVMIEEDVLARYAPLLSEMDWFNPDIYDRYEGARFSPSMLSVISGAERAYREETVGFLKRYMAKPGVIKRPIIPMSCHWFIEGGVSTYGRSIPVEEYVSDQIRPVIAAGADGVALWCATDWTMRLVTTPTDSLSNQMKAEQQVLREQYNADWFAGGVSDWESVTSKHQLRSKLDAIIGTCVDSIWRVYEEVRAAASNTSTPTGGDNTQGM